MSLKISEDIQQNLLYEQLSKVTKLDFDLQVYLRVEASKGPEYSLRYPEDAMEKRALFFARKLDRGIVWRVSPPARLSSMDPTP